jgi:signal peptide peptidase SppA
MRYALRVGEHLAISQDAIRHDASGFFLLLGGDPPDNETRGSVTIVNIRGALQQYKGDGGDSYEAIVERVSEAFAADPKPSDVVLRISSPGGLVAGLDRCVAKLRRMSKEASVPLTAYVDELAASAAFALCCACDEVLTWKSGIVGSIGVISQMVSVAEADKKEGVEFRIITSGKRKADGHLHMPISKDAESAERMRNEELANQFFELASASRGIPVKKLASLEAAIYLGREAEKLGLVDEVMDLDEALYGLDTSSVSGEAPPAPNNGNATDRRAKEEPLDNGSASALLSSTNATDRVTYGESMPAKLSALIKRTEAAIATESDPRKLGELRAKHAAFLVARSEMDDDGDDDKNKDKVDDDDDESKSAKHAARAAKLKAKAKATDLRSKAAEHKGKAAEYEEEAKKCEEEASGSEEDDDEEEEARLRAGGSTMALTPGTEEAAALAVLQSVTGLQGSAALGAVLAKLSRLTSIEADVTKMKSESEARELADLRARASRYVQPKLVATLNLSGLRAMVAEAEKNGTPMVATKEGDLIVPKYVAPDSEAALPSEAIAMIDSACANFTGDREKLRADLVKAHLRAHHDRIGAAMNGAAGRL